MVLKVKQQQDEEDHNGDHENSEAFSCAVDAPA
jgi:hypothetical protein